MQGHIFHRGAADPLFLDRNIYSLVVVEVCDVDFSVAGSLQTGSIARLLHCFSSCSLFLFEQPLQAICIFGLICIAHSLVFICCLDDRRIGLAHILVRSIMPVIQFALTCRRQSVIICDRNNICRIIIIYVLRSVFRINGVVVLCLIRQYCILLRCFDH